MKLMPQEREQELTLVESKSNRRRRPRVGGRFGVIYSGMDKGQIMMGDGQVLNLSREGIGIRADRLLKPGMELALFIELPDSDDPLCISEALVSWVNKGRFGVSLRTLRLEDQNRLRFFLWAHEQQKPAQHSEDIDSTT
ncbi:MAG: PilZ domain-containing protein [Nitrospirae bacterium]|nr:PilZ domain-containing protein [Nitrospirota bacterium]